ncbi:hypothetical protein J6590_077425 [Homalodisca vitripennis]|nr:hypothetical protein J6590_077425 [Homalodisca vitripennis]
MRNPDTPTNCSLVYKDHCTLRVIYNEFGNNSFSKSVVSVTGKPDTPNNCSLVYKDHRTLRVVYNEFGNNVTCA